MDVWIFGNRDDEKDSLPVRLLPMLAKKFPHFRFIHKNPLDDDEFPEDFIIIDCVKGLDRVTTYTSLDDFAESPRVTVHDFDLLSQLALAKKTNRLRRFCIVGIPFGYDEHTALKEASAILSEF